MYIASIAGSEKGNSSTAITAKQPITWPPSEWQKKYTNKVYINGEELDESAYLNDNVVTDGHGGVFTDLVVPEGCVFAMGDNRPGSGDCRRFGCIPLEKIEGVVTIRFWPLNKFGTIKKAE